MSQVAAAGVTRNSVVYLASRLGPAILSFFVLGTLTRLLTPEDFGIYVSALATIGLVSVGTYNPIHISLVRLSPIERENPAFRPSILGIFGLTTATVLLGVGLCVLIAPLDRSEANLILAGACYLISQGWLEVNMQWLVARSQAVHYLQFGLLRSVCVAGSVFGVALAGAGPSIMLATSAGAMLIPSMLLGSKLWRGMRLSHWTWAESKRIARFGFPLSLTFMLDNVLFYSDRLMLARMASLEAAGLYAAGYEIADKGVKVIMYSVGSATLPVAVKVFEAEGREAVRAQLERNVSVLLMFGLPAAVGLSLVAPELSSLLGPAYRELAGAVIPPVAMGTFFACLRSNYIDHAFHLAKTALPLTLVTAATTAVNIGLNFFMIPAYGALGAAYATLASFVFAAVAGFLAARHAFALPIPLRSFVEILLGTSVMAAAVMAIPRLGTPIASLIVEIAAGTLAYAAATAVFNRGSAVELLLKIRSRLPAALCGEVGSR